MERRKVKLGEIASFVTDKVRSDNITLAEYVTTDSLLQNKAGRTVAQNLPPQPCSLTRYKPGDVLIGNIRPYLKKIWLADGGGGCSNDVLAFRAKEGFSSSFLYAILSQDTFFDYLMLAAKGSKMPRGDKDHAMRFKVPFFPIEQQRRIGKLLSSIDRKIALNRRMNATLEAMARQLYDYWFLQFDFPDAHSKPYKSSGGKMTWNDKLKRDIPEGWSVIPLHDGAEVQYGFPFSTELFVESETGYPVVRIRDILDGTTSAFTTEVPDVKYQILKGDVIVGMDGNFHMNFWHVDTTFLNQRCVRLRAKNNSAISAMQIYFDINPYIKAKELNAKGSTVAHLSDKDIKSLYLIKPCDSKAFDPRVPFDAILSNIISCRVNISTLTRLRTTFLPLLMNGQVSVS